MNVSLNSSISYFIFQLSRINNSCSLALNAYVHFCLWFCSHVILTVLIGIVRFISFSLLLFEFLQLLIDVELIPRIVIIFYSVCVSYQINALLIAWLIFCFNFLFISFFLQLLFNFLLFGPFLFQNLIFGLLLQSNLLFPIVQVRNIVTDLFSILFDLALYFETHLWLLYVLKWIKLRFEKVL